MPKDNNSVKKAQKKNQASQKARYKSITVKKKGAGALGIGKSKYSTRSAEGTTGGGRVAKTKEVTKKVPVKVPKFSKSVRVLPSEKKKKPKSIKVKTTVHTGGYKSMPFKKKKN